MKQVEKIEGKNALFQISLWEKDIEERPEGINPKHIEAFKMEKLNANQ